MTYINKLVRRAIHDNPWATRRPVRIFVCPVNGPQICLRHLRWEHLQAAASLHHQDWLRLKLLFRDHLQSSTRLHHKDCRRLLHNRLCHLARSHPDGSQLAGNLPSVHGCIRLLLCLL